MAQAGGMEAVCHHGKVVDDSIRDWGFRFGMNYGMQHGSLAVSHDEVAASFWDRKIWAASPKWLAHENRPTRSNDCASETEVRDLV